MESLNSNGDNAISRMQLNFKNFDPYKSRKFYGEFNGDK